VTVYVINKISSNDDGVSQSSDVHFRGTAEEGRDLRCPFQTVGRPPRRGESWFRKLLLAALADRSGCWEAWATLGWRCPCRPAGKSHRESLVGWRADSWRAASCDTRGETIGHRWFSFLQAWLRIGSLRGSFRSRTAAGTGNVPWFVVLRCSELLLLLLRTF